MARVNNDKLREQEVNPEIKNSSTMKHPVIIIAAIVAGLTIVAGIISWLSGTQGELVVKAALYLISIVGIIVAIALVFVPKKKGPGNTTT